MLSGAVKLNTEYSRSIEYLDITDMQILFQNGQSFLVKFSSRKTVFDCAIELWCRLQIDVTGDIS